VDISIVEEHTISILRAEDGDSMFLCINSKLSSVAPVILTVFLFIANSMVHCLY
jgi:hypothetical protein